MNPDHIEQNIRALFHGVLNKDTVIQRQTIERAYYEDAKLQNPYLLLSNRDQIIRSYAGLSNSCTELLGIVKDVSYDPKTQIATVNLIQTIKPKALGGVLAITTHQRLKLQLESNESSNNGTLLIVEHSEVHLAQDLIKQMPIIGKWYEHGIRTAIGQLSMAGTSVLNATGILDLFPAAVRISTDTARGVKMKANAFANRALEVGVPALEATGVTPLVRDVYGLTNRAVGWATNTTKEAAQLTKSAAVKLIEDGRGENIDCYSPTCEPGKRCYSPTCPRGNTYELLSVDAVADIVKGAYQGVGRTTGLLTTHEES